jgi:hypothetical protein
MNTVQHADAFLLSGGSAFGLAAADGAMRWLEERGIGFDTGFARVPVVAAAVLYDLGEGSVSVRPGTAEGYAACAAAAFSRLRRAALERERAHTVGKAGGMQYFLPRRFGRGVHIAGRDSRSGMLCGKRLRRRLRS